MGTWTRGELKQRAKQILGRTYGKVLVITIILMFVQSFAGGFNFNFSFDSSDIDIEDMFGGNLDSATRRQLAKQMGENFMEALEDQWQEVLPAILGMLSIFLIMFLFGFLIKLIIKAFAVNPLMVSAQKFLLSNRVRDDANLGELDYAFKNNYKNIALIIFFRDLYVFLWSLLFWIPGIVKAYEYRMIPYLLAENPYLSKEDAFRISKEMMDGEKWNAFVLDLSFFGWYLLSVFTCGILAVFYVSPYQILTNTELYVALSLKTGGSYKNYQQDQYGSYGQNYQQGQYGGYDQNNQQGQYGGYGQNYQQGQYGGYDQYYNQGQNGNGNSGQ